ncbi:hypothetical protein KA013_01640, partial [Patescibacteria group bacterium]|nr:hypothetical protein [Patescibacteria group bacterium]
SNEEISFPSTSKKTRHPKSLVPKPAKKTTAHKRISPKKPDQAHIPATKTTSPTPRQPKVKVVHTSPKKVEKLPPQKPIKLQTTILRPNTIADAPQPNNLQKLYLSGVDLHGTYHDSYHPKFYDFFQNKLRATGSVYTTSINSAIDEFL